jgi:RNA polymerase sigma-70 factor (ECF subfamily)
VKWEMSRRSEKEVFDMEFALPEMTPDEVLQFDELTQKIEATIAELPPQCRNVFLMSRFETKKNKDIAQNLGISIKAVEAHVSKALHMLRIALKEN